MTEETNVSSRLRQLVRDVAGTMPDEATPLDIAAATIDKAPEDVTAELVTLLAYYVPSVIGGDRRDCFNHRGQAAAGSKKLERRAAWWARTLDSRVCVGDHWKRLGDCTADDLRVCIDSRRSLIASIEAQIGNYETILTAMETAGALVVSELQADQVNL